MTLETKNTTPVHVSEFDRNESFMKLPMWLFLDERYKDLPPEAKILYAALADRSRLSGRPENRTRYTDSLGFIFCIYSLEDMMKLLNCSKPAALKYKKALMSYGLLREIRQHSRKPNLLYVMPPKNPQVMQPENNPTDKYLKTLEERCATEMWGHFENVKLSYEEYMDLLREMTFAMHSREKGGQELHYWIDRLSTYLMTSGKHYNSHYALIREWSKAEFIKRAAERGPVNHPEHNRIMAELEEEDRLAEEARKLRP